MLAGFAVGMVIFSLDILNNRWKIFWLLIGVALTIVFFTVTLERMYSGDVQLAEELRDVCGYYKQYFEEYECKCMLDQHRNN